jgi:hypothetical protein
VVKYQLFVNNVRDIGGKNQSLVGFHKGIGKWQIDHRIPISFFNMEDLTEQKQAFFYKNCQPMWFEKNLKKGDRIIPEYASYLP